MRHVIQPALHIFVPHRDNTVLFWMRRWCRCKGSFLIALPIHSLIKCYYSFVVFFRVGCPASVNFSLKWVNIVKVYNGPRARVSTILMPPRRKQHIGM
jgi:hypothetical protein